MKLKFLAILGPVLITACVPRTNISSQEQVYSKPPLNKQSNNNSLADDPANLNRSINNFALKQNQEKILSTNISGKGQSISSWDLSGALAARSNNKGWTAAINWLQQGSNNYQ